ncbi:serine hydrolase [Exiguobacterium sp. BMC-KP]|uniref:serine hydrolase n=1 Tax=Exiguobacterium sp. BMC-KP TaxID=1684312 RepID=UPI000A6FCAEE|nr:serine hydrolase [Exiguobacterium sp. BMC-KP]
MKELTYLPNLTHFEGVVSIHQEGELIFSHADGFAHRGYRVLNTETTRFGIASGAKLFTAVAILRLTVSRDWSTSTRSIHCNDSSGHRN